MAYLYVFNICYFLFISVAPIVYLSKKFKLGYLNPITITFIVSLPILLMKTIGGPSFILDEGLLDKWFNFALLMTSLQLTILFFLTIVFLWFIKKSHFLHVKCFNFIKPIKLKKKRMVLLSMFFLALFILCFYMLTKEYGLLNWVMHPRVGYQYYRVGSGHWYALSLLFLSTSYALVIIYSRHVVQVFIVFIIYSSLVYFLGSKGFIFSFFTFFLVVLWFRESKYLSISLYIVTPLAFLLMLLNFNPSEAFNVFEYFDYYVNSAMYYEAYFSKEIDLFYGQLWLTDFYKYLPRFIFEDKPYVYGFLHVNEFFFPGAAEKTNTPAFGGPVSIFADFGVFGLILFSVFNIEHFIRILLLYYLYSQKSFSQVQYNSNNFFIFIWMLAPSFMTFFGPFYALSLFIVFIYLTRFVNRIKI